MKEKYVVDDVGSVGKYINYNIFLTPIFHLTVY